MKRRAFLGGASALMAMPSLARAQSGPRLTPAVQRIDPRPALPGSFEARAAAAMPAYRPTMVVEGPIRLWGHGNRQLPWMRNLIDLWSEGFTRFHPNSTIAYAMWGTSSGIPALFNGRGDLAILGEEILPDAARAFEHFKGYPPTGIELMTGSLDIRNFDYAQQVFVHRDNPLERITLAQLDGVLGTECRRGGPLVRRWGDVGLAGNWTGRPVTPYSWAIDDSFGFYLRNAVLLGSHRWNPALREFGHIVYPDGRIYDHGQQILDALAKDANGIAVSNIRYADPSVKPVALAHTSDGPFLQASKASLIEQTYPLARTLPAVIDVPPDGHADPRVVEFLRYILSREGQQAVTRDGRYLPLSPGTAAAQRRALP